MNRTHDQVKQWQFVNRPHVPSPSWYTYRQLPGLSEGTAGSAAAPRQPLLLKAPQFLFRMQSRASRMGSASGPAPPLLLLASCSAQSI